MPHLRPESRASTPRWTSAGLLLVLAFAWTSGLLLTACGDDRDEVPNLDISNLPVRYCPVQLDQDTACDVPEETVWLANGVCLHVDVVDEARQFCELVRVTQARPAVSGEMSVHPFSWNIDLRWSLDLRLHFPEECFPEGVNDCREVADSLSRRITTRTTCIGRENCDCSLALSGTERSNGTILNDEAGTVLLNDGGFYHACAEDRQLQLRPVASRSASRMDVTWQLRPRR